MVLIQDESAQNQIKLLVFLKGSNKQKMQLQKDHPELFAHFQEVWKVRDDHLVHELPSQYMFYLV